jgi:hypothetical protein
LLNQLGFLPGLKQILTLRQVHALEHATVWLLTQTPQRYPSTQLVGGMSTDRGFYLYGLVEDSDLRQTVAEALERITRGEWNLAIHPECGTNLSVGLLLALGLTLGLAAGLPKDASCPTNGGWYCCRCCYPVNPWPWQFGPALPDHRDPM